MTDRITRSTAIVGRVVGEQLAYATVDDARRTLAFVPDAMAGNGDGSFRQQNIEAGARVTLEWVEASGTVLSVSLLATAPRTRDGGSAELDAGQAARQQPAPSVSQLELHPSRGARSTLPVQRALPLPTRRFARLIDTGPLRAGDLLLSRELTPDGVSRAIADVQTRGGYSEMDAQWTHAAMYVGDGMSVVEATFDSPLSGGSVRLTSLDEYCTGACSLRFRRSKFIAKEQDGWRLCVRALSRLKEPYGLFQAAEIWFKVVFTGLGFYDSALRRPTDRAVFCSTLYADAYNEATRRSLGEVNGTCVPSWLSASDEFEDIQAEWIAIG